MEGSASSGKAGGGRKSSGASVMAGTATVVEQDGLVGVKSGRLGPIPWTGRRLASRRSSSAPRPRSGRPQSPATVGVRRVRVSGMEGNRGRGRTARGRREMSRLRTSSASLSSLPKLGDGRDRRRRSTACARARSSFQLVKTPFFRKPP
jgi:hypothetical protein